jgi:hypothetical protein
MYLIKKNKLVGIVKKHKFARFLLVGKYPFWLFSLWYANLNWTGL